MTQSPVSAPKSLLDPKRSVLVLMDYQPMTLFGVRSHDPQTVVNNVTALAKMGRAFDVPVILTTIAGSTIGGEILPELQALFPDQKPIDRSWINAWEDPALRDAVLATGRDQIVMAGLWTEMCLAHPALHAREEGRQVYAVADASGGVSEEAHSCAMQRMVQAGVVPLTTGVILGEFQRDWARTETYDAVVEIARGHLGNFGQAANYYQTITKLLNAAADARHAA